LRGNLLPATIIIALSATIIVAYYYQQKINSGIEGLEYEPSIPPLYEAFMSKAKEVSLTELRDIMKSKGYELLVPRWLPEGIKLSTIYYKCCPLVVIMVYSDRGTKDYRYANITIEIAPFDPRYAPSEEYLQGRNNPPKEYVVKIRDLVAIVIPESMPGDPEQQRLFGSYPLAVGWRNGLEYIIAVKRPLTVDDLISLLNSLSPA